MEEPYNKYVLGYDSSDGSVSPPHALSLEGVGVSS